MGRCAILHDDNEHKMDWIPRQLQRLGLSAEDYRTKWALLGGGDKPLQQARNLLARVVLWHTANDGIITHDIMEDLKIGTDTIGETHD